MRVSYPQLLLPQSHHSSSHSAQRFFEEIALSLSLSSFTPPERLNTFEHWVGLRISTGHINEAVKTFRCPFSLCGCLYYSVASAIAHSYSCNHWHCSQYACHACDRFDDFRRSIKPAYPPLSAKSLQRPQPTATALRSIGDQFAETELPQHIIIPGGTRGNTGRPGILISTASWELQQPRHNPGAFARASSSEYDVRPTLENVTAPLRFVKSETNVDTDSGALRKAFFRPQHAFEAGVSQTEHINRFADVVVRLCGLTFKSHFETLRVLVRSPIAFDGLATWNLINVVERGLTAFKELCEHRSTLAFESVYCFVHIVMASVRIVHEDEIYDWHALKNSLIRLGYNIGDKNGRAIYPHVLECIWQGQCNMSADFGPNFAEISVNTASTTVREEHLGLQPIWGIDGNEKALKEAKAMIDRKNVPLHVFKGHS